MKLTLFSILAFVLMLVSGAALPQKAIIVTYPGVTPDSVLNQAMDEIRKVGGMITHEFKLIKGFAARAPLTVVDSIQTLGAQYNVVVEEDQIVNASGR